MISINYNNNISRINSLKMNMKNNPSFKKSDGDVLEITGTQTKAKVYTNNITPNTYSQIQTICSHPVFKDLPIRIMPDTHAGKNTVVGFTAPIGVKGSIIPSIISGDIGCGMLCVNIDTQGQDIDFKKLDDIIRTYAGTSHNRVSTTLKENSKDISSDIKHLCSDKLKVSSDKIMSSLGTLGSGNHFIELDKDEKGEVFLVIHSGSRGLGQAVFNKHLDIAKKQNPYQIEDLSYLTDDEAKDYLQDMQLATKYAQVNRRIIADEILKGMGWKEKSSFESIHNYIGQDGIIRKGAISSNNGEKILIPLNMHDGSLIATGKGNSDWNNSAPHGAGRKLSRNEANKEISLDEYQKTMSGIYTTCISIETLDEAPQAYKDSTEIEQNIQGTAAVDSHIKPIYNFKN